MITPPPLYSNQHTRSSSTPTVIVPTPRLSSRKRYATTPPPFASPSCRFIPQRSRMDIAQTRASFSSSWSQQRQQQVENKTTTDFSDHYHEETTMVSATTSMTQTLQKQNYDRHLKRVLLGRNKNGGLYQHYEEEDTDHTTILAFGPSRPAKRPRLHTVAAPTPMLRPIMDDPYRQDVLRNALVPSLSSSLSPSHHIQRRHGCSVLRVSIDMAVALDAPNFHPRFRHLIGYSSTSTSCSSKDNRECMLAVALYDKVYLWNKGVVQLVAGTEGGGPWTCLQWSTNGTQLALAMRGKIVVYDSTVMSLGDDGAFYSPTVKITSLPQEDVTAMAFKGSEIVVGCENGSILRYNIRIYPGCQQKGKSLALHRSCDHQYAQNCHDPPIEETYQSHRGGNAPVTAIQWKGNVIATAGGGTIQLFDSHKKTTVMGRHQVIAPSHVMEHTGVMTLEFCAKQPNLLVSGGSNGLQFWNVGNGLLRGSIALPGRVVVGTLCSTQNHEILVAHGNSFSLWSLATKEGERIMDEPSSGGHLGSIRTMIRGPNGRIVCAHDDEAVTMHTIRREISKEKARATTLGLLVVPVVR